MRDSTSYGKHADCSFFTGDGGKDGKCALYEGLRGNMLSKVACVTLLVSMAFQNVTIVGTGGGSGLKPYHLIVVAALIMTIAMRGREWRIPSLFFTLTILVLTALSLAASFFFGLTTVTINYLVLLTIVAVFLNLGEGFDLIDWEQVARVGSALILAAVLGNLLLQSKAMLTFLSNPGYHPELETLYGGGVNLEATWLAMFGVFYERNWKGVTYIGLCTLVAGLYLSRVGIVLCLIVALYVFFFRPYSGSYAPKILLLLLITVIIIWWLVEIDSPIIDRFASIGNDNGTRGRMLIWENIWESYLQSPLIGHGAGNAMSAVSEISGRVFQEDNVHNYYAQVLIDFGIVGFALFSGLIAKYSSVARCHFAAPFVFAIVLFFLAALIQFRGGESMLGFFLAGYFACSQFWNRESEFVHAEC